jgi:hypothetical protein
MIKALVTVATNETVQLLITGGELPVVGAYYTLEDAVEGTAAQNRTFHALTLEYFKSGQSSYDADNYADFKNQIKRHLGEGFDGYVYIDVVLVGDNFDISHYKMYDVKNKSDIPEHVIRDPHMKDMIRGKLKSWSCYTKKQRKNCIDAVINEMLQAGINTKKFQEILKGMNYELL